MKMRSYLRMVESFSNCKTKDSNSRFFNSRGVGHMTQASYLAKAATKCVKDYKKIVRGEKLALENRKNKIERRNSNSRRRSNSRRYLHSY